MNELIQKLTSELGISEFQAKGGLGGIFKIAKDQLGGDFSQISEKLPGISDLISGAPSVHTQPASGFSGIINSAISAVGGDAGRNLQSLTSMFDQLNLDSSMIGKFAPIVFSYLKDNVGGQAADLIRKMF